MVLLDIRQPPVLLTPGVPEQILVPATPDREVHLMSGLFLSIAADANFRFVDTENDVVSVTFEMGLKGGFMAVPSVTFPYCPLGWFVTKTGRGLVIVNEDDSDVRGVACCCIYGPG